MGFLKPIDQLKPAELPAKTKSFWRLAGPGAILVGLSIGAGEIIIWPRIIAEYGSTMIWAAVVGVFLQLWINFEIGRWTACTGETSFTGFARVWRGFAPLFILLTILGWLAPGWGQASGLAVKALLVGPTWHLDAAGKPVDFFGTKTFWTTLTFLGVALVLFGPKLVYNSVERTVEVLVVIITIGLIIVALRVGTAEHWKSMGQGLVNIGQLADQGKRRLQLDIAAAADLDRAVVTDALREAMRVDLELTSAAVAVPMTVHVVEPGQQWRIDAGGKSYSIRRDGDMLMVATPALSIKALFIALVFAGAGGTANLFYSFYLRDKHIGMGAKIPTMRNPLRGKEEKIPDTGFTFDDSEVNRVRFQGWWRYLRADQLLFFFVLNSVTILLFIFGALAVLHPQGKVPGPDTLIWDEAVILGQSWGYWGKVVFLIVGVATLFSTQLTLLDGSARSIADIVHTNVAAARKKDVGWWYAVIAVAWMVVGIALTAVMEAMGVTNLGFLFNAAYMGGFAMAVYVPLTLYVNLRYLPKIARPGPVCVFMMVVASLVYVGFAVACVAWEFSERTTAQVAPAPITRMAELEELFGQIKSKGDLEVLQDRFKSYYPEMAYTFDSKHAYGYAEILSHHDDWSVAVEMAPFLEKVSGDAVAYLAGTVAIKSHGCNTKAMRILKSACDGQLPDISATAKNAACVSLNEIEAIRVSKPGDEHFDVKTHWHQADAARLKIKVSQWESMSDAARWEAMVPNVSRDDSSQ